MAAVLYDVEIDAAELEQFLQALNAGKDSNDADLDEQLNGVGAEEFTRSQFADESDDDDDGGDDDGYDGLIHNVVATPKSGQPLRRAIAHPALRIPIDDGDDAFVGNCDFAENNGPFERIRLSPPARAADPTSKYGSNSNGDVGDLHRRLAAAEFRLREEAAKRLALSERVVKLQLQMEMQRREMAQLRRDITTTTTTTTNTTTPERQQVAAFDEFATPPATLMKKKPHNSSRLPLSASPHILIKNVAAIVKDEDMAIV